MKVDKKIVKNYAQALVQIALAENSIDPVEEGLVKADSTISNHLELKDALKNPNLKAAEKRTILTDIFENIIDGLVLEYIILLVNLDKSEIIPELVKEYKVLAQDIRGKTVADVTTAIPLPEEKITSLSAKIAKLVGKDVIVRNKVDASIIGGMLIHVEGKLIDASLKNQFEELKEKIIAGGEG